MSHIKRNQNKKIYIYQQKLKQDFEKNSALKKKKKSYPKSVVFSPYFWSSSHAAKHYILNFPQIQKKVAPACWISNASVKDVWGEQIVYKWIYIIYLYFFCLNQVFGIEIIQIISKLLIWYLLFWLILQT